MNSQAPFEFRQIHQDTLLQLADNFEKAYGKQDFSNSLDIYNFDQTSGLEPGVGAYMNNRFSAYFEKKKLIHLKFERFKIPKISKDLFEDIPDEYLAGISIEECQLKEIEPDAFESLNSLIYLSFRYNNLTSLPRLLKSTLTHLIELDFSHNGDLLSNTTIEILQSYHAFFNTKENAVLHYKRKDGQGLRPWKVATSLKLHKKDFQVLLDTMTP